jgi:hypothetical protein
MMAVGMSVYEQQYDDSGYECVWAAVWWQWVWVCMSSSMMTVGMSVYEQQYDDSVYEQQYDESVYESIHLHTLQTPP